MGPDVTFKQDPTLTGPNGYVYIWFVFLGENGRFAVKFIFANALIELYTLFITESSLFWVNHTLMLEFSQWRKNISHYSTHTTSLTTLALSRRRGCWSSVEIAHFS